MLVKRLSMSLHQLQWRSTRTSRYSGNKSWGTANVGIRHISVRVTRRTSEIMKLIGGTSSVRTQC